MPTTPRGLATDGTNVYVAAFMSGNQTTTVGETFVPDGFDSAVAGGGAPGGVPGPNDNDGGDVAPENRSSLSGLMGVNWKDALGRDWDALVPFSLPDHDVFTW